jgi:hypothetical protein
MSDIVPQRYIKDLKHLTINTWLGISKVNLEHDSISYADMANIDLCFDLGPMQVVKIACVVNVIGNRFEDLKTLTIEFAKTSFVPFARHATNGALGIRAAGWAKVLQELFKLPQFELLILVHKQDTKLDWFAEKVLEGSRWEGEIKIKQNRFLDRGHEVLPLVKQAPRLW